MRLSLKKIDSFFFPMIMFFLIFLGALNFLNRYFVWFFLAFLAFLLCVAKSRIALDLSFFYLLLFSFCILIFSPDTLVKYTYLIKPFIYPFCYLIGYNMFRILKKDNLQDREKIIKRIWILIAFALLIHWFLNISINTQAENRTEVFDYWTHEISSATTMAAIAVIPIGVSCALLLASPNKIEKIFAIISLILIIAFNLLLSGRTIFLMLLICLAIGIIFAFFQNKNKKQKWKIIFGFLLAVFVILFIYNSNLFGVKGFIEESAFYDRFFGENSIELNEDGRMRNKMDHIKNMIYYPWGGDALRESLNWRSAHDLYLDTYSYSSVFSFVFLVLFIFRSLKNAFSLLRSESISFFTKEIIVCTYLVIHIEFFMEPIIRGVPWLFAIYCLMDGLLVAYTRRNKLEESH